MHQVKAIIFDLDGTLANTLPLCISAFRQSIEPLIDRALSDQEISATFGPSEEGTIMALAPNHYNKGVADYLSLYESLHHTCPEPFEGIKELLVRLKDRGVRITMVTGKGKHSTAISLKHFNLTPYFGWIETGSPSGPRKAEGIQLIVDALEGISKEEIIYVGDAPGDITASRKVGIPVIAAAWAATAELETLKAMNPDALFYTINEFNSWLDTRI